MSSGGFLEKGASPLIFPGMNPPWQLRIGLALGGGAARGMAHVGVLRALVREGIPIDFIAGTSMGAVIGAAFAAGKEIEAIEAAVRRTLSGEKFQKTRLAFLRESRKNRGGGLLHSVSRLVKQGIVYGVTTMRPSFVSAEEFADSMAEILPETRVEDFPIRFGAVALDLDAGEEVLLCSGSAREVCAASSAIPGILPPRRLNGRVLIDGGWVDKVPVLPAFRMGADVVIAVDISADLDGRRDYTRGLEIMLRANVIKDAVLTAFHKRIADVVIEPGVRRVHWADFDAYDFCIAAGDLAASEAIPKIREFLNVERWRSLLRPSAGRRLADLYLDSPDLRLRVE